MKRLREILKDESAQGMLEYILILAVVLLIAAMFKKQIFNAVGNLTGKVEGDINSWGGGGGQP